MFCVLNPHETPLACQCIQSHVKATPTSPPAVHCVFCPNTITLFGWRPQGILADVMIQYQVSRWVAHETDRSERRLRRYVWLIIASRKNRVSSTEGDTHL